MNEEFKDAVWEAIENVFYEFNGKRGERFERKDLEEAIEDHARFFDDDEDYEFDDEFDGFETSEEDDMDSYITSSINQDSINSLTDDGDEIAQSNQDAIDLFSKDNFGF